MKDRIRNTIEAALKGAGIAYETDGETIWVDDPETGATHFIGIGECEK